MRQVLACRLHSFEIVTSTGALNSFGASAGDSPISFAPDPGTARQPNAFGRQLQDAREVSTRPELAGRSTPQREASGRGVPKKIPSDSQPLGYGVPTTTPPVETLPFLFRFALAASDFEETPAGQASPALPDVQPQADPPAAAAPLPGDLAFALKAEQKDDAASLSAPQPAVQNEAGDAIASANDSRLTNASERIVPVFKPVANALAAHAPSTRNDDAPENELPQPEKPAAVLMEPMPAHAPAPAAAHTSQSASTPITQEVVEISKDAPVKAPEPLKQLAIQVSDSQQQRVELRFVERSGELQVAVRTASPEVAQGLRQGLPELVGRLDQNGFHTEAWRPGAIVTATQGIASTRQESAQTQNNSSHGQPGSSQQGSQQQNRQQSNRPQWVDELETSIAGQKGSSTGETYGNGR